MGVSAAGIWMCVGVRQQQPTHPAVIAMGGCLSLNFTSHYLIVQAHLSSTLPAELGWASLMATVEAFDTGYPGLGARAL